MIDTKELRGAITRHGVRILNEDEVLELLDRLEAAESDALEQARLNGMGASREAALMAKLEAAEKDIALKERVIDSLGSELNAVANERDALQAKVEEMEKQEPVAELVDGAFDQYPHLKWRGSYKAIVGAKLYTKLYLAPGAQPAPSVPECPYPCGWRNLLKHAIEDGAYLARSINEDEPVTENARAVTMRMVLRLRDVLMALNNAATEAKP